MADEYCDLCDLPKAHCIHGMPPAPPPEARTAAPRATARKTSTPRATQQSAAAAPVRRAPRRWTPPEAIAPVILAVLDEAGGQLAADDVLEAVGARIDEHLLEGDRQLTPEGELRWRYAARRARQQLVKEGLLTTPRPGIWELTSASGTR